MNKEGRHLEADSYGNGPDVILRHMSMQKLAGQPLLDAVRTSERNPSIFPNRTRTRIIAPRSNTSPPQRRELLNRLSGFFQSRLLGQ